MSDCADELYAYADAALPDAPLSVLRSLERLFIEEGLPVPVDLIAQLQALGCEPDPNTL